MTKYGLWRKAGAIAIFALALGAAIPSTFAQEQTSYQYDELGRLVTSCDVSANKLKTFDFDPAGNRTSFDQSSNACGPAFFAISNAASQVEGQALGYTVNRTGNLSQSQSIDYVASAGTAESTDFPAVSGTLTFAISEASKTISVPTTNDSIHESSETVLVDISNPTGGAIITDNQGSGTITDNDSAPSFAISNASVTVGGTLTFTVTKAGATEVTHAVNYATANGTALAGTHYTAKSGTKTFVPSTNSLSVTVNTTSGSVPVGQSKAMYVNLTSPTNNATIADSQGVGTINGPANNPPNAVNDTVTGGYIVYDWVNAYVRNNDSDPEGHTLTVTAASCVSSGCTVSIAGGTHIKVRGTTVGNKTVNYTVSDGFGGTDTAQATVGYFDNDPCPFC